MDYDASAEADHGIAHARGARRDIKPNRNLYTPCMARIVPFTEARAHLTEILDDVEARHEHVVITRKGRPAAIVVSPDEWDAIEETLDILQDEPTLQALRESEEDVKAGRLFSIDEVRRELGLA